MNALSVIALTSHPSYDIQTNLLLLHEAVISMTCYFYVNLMSESLERDQNRVRRAAYQSYWYTMCPEAQRMLLLFLRRTQRPAYMRPFGGMFVLGAGHFMQTLKLIFSFTRFFNLKKKE